MFRGFSSAIDTLLALQDSLDAAKTFDFLGSNTTSSRGIEPSVNLFKDGDTIILMAEIPGLKKEDIKIEVKDNLITLAAERKLDYPKDSSIHRIERRSRSFSRSIRLPVKVEVNEVRADYKNGILSVVLPRAESEKPKQISIN